MKTSEILKEIKKHDWWTEECPCIHQVAEWAWRGFVEGSRYFDKKHLTIGIFIYKDGFLFEETPRDEKIKQFYFLLKIYESDKTYIKDIESRWMKVIDKLEKENWDFIKKITKLTRDEIGRRYQILGEDYVEEGRYSAFYECIDPYTEDVLPELLKKELPKVSLGKRNEIAAIMSTPEFLSFMEIERIDFLSSCKRVMENRSVLDKESKKLEKKYIWMATHYGKAKPKFAKNFKEEILHYIKDNDIYIIEKGMHDLKRKLSRIRKEKKEIIKKYKISRKLNTIFEIICKVGELIDRRKENALQMTFIIYRILEHLEAILRTPSRLLAYTTYDELYNWIKKDKNVPLKYLNERQKLSTFLVTKKSAGKSDYRFITGKEAKKIYDAFFPKQDVSELKGTVASPGKKIKGRVCLVLNTSTDKFREGDILVTTMTRPDFLPIMRKAKAIITDEGGLTCHAAIISRELKIPCIIGTRIATKVLLDRDMIELDANKGIVRKIR